MDFCRKNKLFFLLVLIFLSALTIIRIMVSKEWILFFMGSNRNAHLDSLLLVITYFGEAISFFLVFILLLFFKFRYAFMIPIVGFLGLGTAMLLKVIFQQPRPVRYLSDQQLIYQFEWIENFNIYDNFLSFPSGHTVAAFTLFTFLALIFNNDKIIVVLSFICPALVGLSRMYFLQHFIEDVIFGAILGVLISSLLFVWQLKYLKDKRSWLEKKLTFY